MLDVVGGAVGGDLVEPLPDLADARREVVAERDLQHRAARPPAAPAPAPPGAARPRAGERRGRGAAPPARWRKSSSAVEAA